MKRVRTTWPALALALSLAVAGCGQPVTGTSTGSGRDILYFADNAAGLPVMYQGEPYTANLSVSGGAGPYTMRVTGGSLPPGVKLSGQQLSGTPTATGTYKFTLEVTDSTLSTRAKEYTVNVNTLPPLSIAPKLPSGEIRGETRIPLTITAPRNVRAAQLNWELPTGVSVTRVQASEQSGVLFWQQQGRVLTVDMGFKTIPRNDVRIALITVKPDKPVTLNATKLGYEARDGQGKLLAGRTLAGAVMTETPAAAEAQGDQATPASPGDAAAPATPAATPSTPAAQPVPAQPTPPQTPPTDAPGAPPGQIIDPPNPPDPAPPGASLRPEAPL